MIKIPFAAVVVLAAATIVFPNPAHAQEDMKKDVAVKAADSPLQSSARLLERNRPQAHRHGGRFSRGQV